MKQVRIITRELVDKTFDGESCRVVRTIVSSSRTPNRQEYLIRTEYCNFYDKTIPRLDEFGNQLFTPEGVLITETIQELRVLGRKDFETRFVVDDTLADQLFLLIRHHVVLENSYTSFIESVEQQALLLRTQIDNPYGYGADKWITLDD